MINPEHIIACKLVKLKLGTPIPKTTKFDIDAEWIEKVDINRVETYIIITDIAKVRKAKPNPLVGNETIATRGFKNKKSRNKPKTSNRVAFNLSLP